MGISLSESKTNMKQSLVFLAFFFMLFECSCGFQNSPQSGNNSVLPSEYNQDFRRDETINQNLIASLQREWPGIKPFAWGSWDDKGEKGSVIGIDEYGKLLKIYFSRTGEEYEIRLSDTEHPLNDRIDTSGMLNLQDYITGEEFPFRADRINRQGCTVHFVLVWKAISRSMRKNFALDCIDLRIIIEKGSVIAYNELVGFSFIGLGESFIKDVNGDGKEDYIFIYESGYKHIRCWKVEADCSVHAIRFKEQDGYSTSVPGRVLLLKPDKGQGGFNIYAQMFQALKGYGEAYWEITEKVYEWDAQEDAFEIVRILRRREKSK